jgi:hypothetical protein
MAISTINQNGLNAPLTLTSPVLTTPNLGTPSALVLTNATGLGYAALPAGSVLQVVRATYSINITTSSTTLATTNVTANITPKFTTSKILALISMNGCYNSSSSNWVQFEMFKNGSSISYLDEILLNGLGGGNVSASYQYLDSPATTSSTTYAIYWRSGNGSVIGLNNYANGNNRTISSITLMEIAA